MKTYKQEMPELSLKYKKGDVKKVKIQSSDDAAITLKEMFNADTLDYTEEMIVLFLNRANNTIGYMKVCVGGTTGTVTDTKVIMSSALLAGAQSLIISHNHPSGSMKASNADFQLTRKLRDAAKLMDMKLLDHIIITEDSYYSMADEESIL